MPRPDAVLPAGFDLACLASHGAPDIYCYPRFPVEAAGKFTGEGVRPRFPDSPVGGRFLDICDANGPGKGCGQGPNLKIPAHQISEGLAAPELVVIGVAATRADLPILAAGRVGAAEPGLVGDAEDHGTTGDAGVFGEGFGRKITWKVLQNLKTADDVEGVVRKREFKHGADEERCFGVVSGGDGDRTGASVDASEQDRGKALMNQPGDYPLPAACVEEGAGPKFGNLAQDSVVETVDEGALKGIA